MDSAEPYHPHQLIIIKNHDIVRETGGRDTRTRHGCRIEQLAKA